MGAGDFPAPCAGVEELALVNGKVLTMDKDQPVASWIVIRGREIVTVLLDMTPETYQLYTRDPALVVGESFVDPDGGVTITTEWADGIGATVSVSFGGAPSCARVNPSVSLSPSDNGVSRSMR